MAQRAFLERQTYIHDIPENTPEANPEYSHLERTRRNNQFSKVTSIAEWRENRTPSNRISTGIEDAIQNSRKMILEWPDKRPVSNRISTRIQQAIDSSRKILEWPDDWDDEGSKSYKAATWERSVKWLQEAAIAYHKQLGIWIEPPQILPGPEGSIDIHWKIQEYERRELLINFSENEDDPVEYYGQGNKKDLIKGSIDISQSSVWILSWLMK